MTNLQVDLTIDGREFDEDEGLHEAIEEGRRTKLTGSMTIDGVTYSLVFEDEAGEYGGATLDIVPDLGEHPNYDAIHDAVFDLFKQRLWDAVAAASKAYEAALSTSATTTETIEVSP